MPGDKITFPTMLYTVCMRLGCGGNFMMNDIQVFTAGYPK